MYFNRRVIATVAIISNYGIAEAGTCKQSIVDAASEAGFLKFALLNCVPSTTGGTDNKLNKKVLDPQTCLQTFTATNSKVSFVGAGDCLNTYTRFITGILGDTSSPFVASTGTASTYDPCSYDATNDQILVSYVCWNKLSTHLMDFQQSAGYPIVKNACDGSFVRSQALLNPLQDVVTKALKSISDGTQTSYFSVDYTVAAAIKDGDNHIVVGKWAKDTSKNYKANGVDLNLGMCYGAYQTLFDVLQGNDVLLQKLGSALGSVKFGSMTAGPADWATAGGVRLAGVQAACKADITSAGCSGTQLMTGLKSLFNNLSGYDIDFTGPLCSADTISKLDSSSLTPTPYQFFVMCGLMSSQYPIVCSTSSVAHYVASLNSTVGTECNGCYNEMYSSIQKLLSDSTVTSVCNSLPNVTSDACVASMTKVASGFKNCTGVNLYTKVPSSLPTPSNGTNTNNTNGNSPNGASRAAINSGIIVLIAVLTYLV